MILPGAPPYGTDPRLKAARSLLPEAVVVTGAPIEARAEPLFEVEAEGLGDAVETRRHEFALGRTCARDALARLGIGRVPMPVADRRAPTWPPGAVGSISHTRTFCVAAVARAGDFRGVGIDVEELQELPGGVADLVLTDHEREVLEPGSELIAFSAKEAVFKLWWPLAGSWLDFDDVSVWLEPGAGRFRAQISPREAESRLSLDGRFAVTAGLVFTAVALPR